MVLSLLIVKPFKYRTECIRIGAWYFKLTQCVKMIKILAWQSAATDFSKLCDSTKR